MRVFYDNQDLTISYHKSELKENLNQSLKIEGNNSFKDLLIKMQFSRAVLSKDLKISDTWNKGLACRSVVREGKRD